MNIPIETCDTVIFDLGNVLVMYDWKNCLQKFGYAPDVYEAVAKAVFLSPTWQEGDRGTYGKEDWCDAFVKNAPKYEKEIREVYRHLGETILSTDYTDALIRYFKEKGYALYYLSNYSEEVFEQSKDTLKFLNEFDGGVFSWQAKQMKPDPSIYQTLLRKYKLAPERSLFFDDLQANVDAACREGIHGIVFTPSVALEILRK